MEESEVFKKLFNELSKHSSDARKPNNCFGTGKILGYTWRLFQERSDGKYIAWVGINDESSVGSRWPAFYTIGQLRRWLSEKKVETK